MLDEIFPTSRRALDGDAVERNERPRPADCQTMLHTLQSARRRRASSPMAGGVPPEAKIYGYTALKYTKTDYLAMSGRSNGGLLVGAVMTQRPDLMKVALPH